MSEALTSESVSFASGTALLAAAHKAVTEFVNAQHCKSRGEVLMVLGALLERTQQAILVVRDGKMEKLS